MSAGGGSDGAWAATRPQTTPDGACIGEGAFTFPPTPPLTKRKELEFSQVEGIYDAYYWNQHRKFHTDIKHDDC